MNKELKAFICAIGNETKRNDSSSLLALMEEESGYEAKLYKEIIGYGNYRYKYANGREGDAIVTGFSPRQN